MSDARRYLWDFFGPDAQATASHFERHLADRLGQLGVAALATGVASEGQGHVAAFCVVVSENYALVEKTLRPQRALPAQSASDGAAPSST